VGIEWRIFKKADESVQCVRADDADIGFFAIDPVRGQGLLLGLKCVAPNTDVVKAGYDAHVLTVAAADNVIRILPALNIPDSDIAEALARLDRAATDLAATLT
jgi:acetylornithine/succinyldiaminopimelate/putrescine aminotransferase